MKHLVLILTLATGEQTRDLVPAFECYDHAAFIERRWSEGATLQRDTDDVRLIDVRCEQPTWAEWIAPTDGDCGDET